MLRSLFRAVTCALFWSILATPARGQLEPPSTGGLVALSHELRLLGHYKRVLMIGAHPDDEDTELLTLLVRGMGAEAAYLSLNRGEGGQNLIGHELGTSLGILRTEELLAARRLDGARQFFTRAYDFGFSKTLEETWRHWPRDTVLKDVVRIIRRFRPQIIVAIFSGTPNDGHGQHQAAGWAALEAFTAAGDSLRFRELLVEEGLRPWTPKKLYRSARVDTAATTLTLESGVLDPATGRSYHQIAMASRSLHRSQDMGQLQRLGPARIRLAFLAADSTVDSTANTALFAGLDTTLAAMPWTDVTGTSTRALFAARVDSARGMIGNGEMVALAALLRRTEADLLAPKKDSIARLVLMMPEQAGQLRALSRARAIASGTVLDALADDDRLAPGQRVRVTTSVWNAGDVPQAIVPSIVPPAEWAVEDDSTRPAPIAPGDLLERTATLGIAADAAPTTPYYLRQPLAGAMYDWRGLPPPLLGEPFGAPRLAAAFTGPAFGARVEREIAFRVNDQGVGEIRRPLTVIPRVDVKLDPEHELWPARTVVQPRRFTVTLTHGARDTTAGVVRLVVPTGWPAVEGRRFRLTQEDEQRILTFDVTPPDSVAADTVEIRAVAEDASGRRYDVGVVTVDYPHIRPRTYTKRAASSITIAPVALPKLTRVGYIRGASDRVPEALHDVGVPITVLDAEALRRGDLTRYDAIIVGPRAYETDAALVANNARLLDYARRGGLVIVQYQQHRFFRGDFAPYPLTVGGPPLPVDGQRDTDSLPARRPVSHDRVTDETAPVQVLTQGDSIVTTPNRLGANDWRGWVQERGLYFARSWDAAYRPVLAMHDPGEAPLHGGLLVAAVGRGTYVYSGLSFFRQLPAGVPGAYRLFANLLALRGGRR